MVIQVTQVDSAHGFTYTVTGGTLATDDDQDRHDLLPQHQLFNVPKLRQGNPHYYTILPVEHCSDAALTTCTVDDADRLLHLPSTGALLPQPVRRLPAGCGNRQ